MKRLFFALLPLLLLVGCGSPPKMYPLVGIWEWKQQLGGIRITFRADQTYEEEYFGLRNMAVTGTYKVQGDHIQFSPKNRSSLDPRTIASFKTDPLVPTENQVEFTSPTTFNLAREQGKQPYVKLDETGSDAGSKPM